MPRYILHPSGEAVSLGPVLARGGEATLHTLPTRPDTLAKLYTRQIHDIEDKLAAMIAAPPSCLTLGGGYAELIWPLEIIKDADAGNGCAGYAMRYVRNRLSLELIANPATCPPEIDFPCRLRMATNLAWMLAELHTSGFVVGDLHLQNMLGDRAGCVSFIDTDSYQFTAEGRVFRCCVGKADCLPAELYNISLDTVDRVAEHDAFALAVCIFKLLMDGNHPFAGEWLGTGPPPPLPKRISEGWWPYAVPAPTNCRPRALAPPFDMLHPRVQDAMTGCFHQGIRASKQRPSASDWHQALVAAANDRPYLDHVAPLFQAAPWRSKTQQSRFWRRQKRSAGHRQAGSAAPARTYYSPKRLRRPKWRARLAATATVISLLFYLTAYRPAPPEPPPQDHTPTTYSVEKHGKGKPTPRLWEALRDTPN